MTTLLSKRFGNIEDGIRASILNLSATDLDALIEVLLDFDSERALKDWLEQRAERSFTRSTVSLC